MPRCLLAALLILLLAPAAAPAATATVAFGDSCADDLICSRYGGGQPIPLVVVTAAPGEANRLSVAQGPDGVTVHDDGALITPQGPCVAVDPRTVRCPAGGGPTVSGFSAALGDGDDTAVVSGAIVNDAFIDGGAGADKLTGGPGEDQLAGGEGADVLDGGAGGETLQGGGGRDVLRGGIGDDSLIGGMGDDVTDGGEGLDGVYYFDHPTGVTVRRSAATAGAAGELDRLVDVEAVYGSRHADRLEGGPDEDELDGLEGADVVTGGGGADLLSGGVGADRVSGGAGDDVLEGDPEASDDPYDGEFTPAKDRLDGGAGDDVLIDAAGGGDDLRGGAGSDRLDVAGAGAARLSGGSGTDRLLGGSGRDRLDGGSGADRLDGRGGVDDYRGGSGADQLTTADRRVEPVRCGAGRDRVSADRRDRLTGCELRRYSSRR